jgi:hypothetical protein
MDKVVRATIETTEERVRLVFSMKQLNQLFLNLSFSMNEQSSTEEVLSLSGITNWTGSTANVSLTPLTLIDISNLTKLS